MSRLLYILQETGRSLYRAKLITIVSIATIALILFFMTLAYSGFRSAEIWLSSYKQEEGVAIYLSEEIDSTHYFWGVLREHFPDNSMRYSSSDEEYLLFKSRHGELALEGIDENPFLPVLTVENIGSDMSASIEFFSNHPFVADLIYPEEWIAQMSNLMQLLKRIGTILAALGLTILFFTISNTVKLTIYARKDLIINMQYLGASRFYIGGPFFFEGVVQGGLGAAVAAAGVHLIGDLPLPWSLYFNHYTVVALLSLGMLLGALGSLSALRKISQ